MLNDAEVEMEKHIVYRALFCWECLESVCFGQSIA